MKVYAGSPAAARVYLEADRGRADDYYLAEGTGLARRFVAREGRVQERASLTGDGYETWVAGRDPDIGVPRGRLRTDERAVRFVEVVVNGPKSWSLAAAVHHDVAGAYDAAQDRAAAQIIGWLAEHATTRIGPRAGQVQVPVEVLEAVTVRHYTSRAGDPHRHLHLQINARVFAAGRWRGLHTVGVRDFLAAINGIGHAAVACDPQFRAALAAHGYTLDAIGEIPELADHIGPFSARAAQIGRNLDRYERDWMAAHPGESPGPVLRRSWDARAWADGRPDKVTPQSGADLVARWRAELAALGYRDPAHPVALASTPVGALDRDHIVERILIRLAAARSAWNAADVRGEAERLIAAEGVVGDPSVRTELTEDFTARAVAHCVPLLQHDGVPEHVRAWTSAAVLDVEAELTVRLADRSIVAEATRRPDREPELPAAALARLDTGQAAAAAALAGGGALIVVEGAAGAGKTTLLTAARDLLDAQGCRLMVVTPTLKGAKVAAAEVGAAAGSAAWLAFEHGWRWSDDGAWTRLAPGQVDPVTGLRYAGPRQTARLAAGDLLVVDEAGMLDQDTARALLTVADEFRVRLALIGDRHQLAAVGRGGVLDLAAHHADAAALLTLDRVHRFTRTDPAGRTTPDTEYAELTLAMRAGADPAAVFDALAARGRIRLHADPTALQEALAATAAVCYGVGERVAVVVDTREQAAELSAAIRDRLVAGGRVDDTQVVTTTAGQRIGVGDQVATRRNHPGLGVANRETWTVTAVDGDGRLTVTPTAENLTPAGGALGRQWVLPADYVTSHVELAYVSTAHGVQGDTVTAAHVVIGEHTGAAAAYVGMTRGRTSNTAHLIAADLPEARAQWIAVFGRDRADLGPAHAAGLAAAEAARYANPRPLDAVLAELHAAWTIEQRCRDRLAIQEPMRAALQELTALQPHSADRLAALTGTYQRAATAAEEAKQRVEIGDAAVAAEADRFREALLRRWDSERCAASAAARVVLDGPGWLGFRRGAVARAGEQLLDWADRGRPHVPELPADPAQLAQVAGWFDDRPALWAALDAYARRAADHAHPERDGPRAAAEAAHRAFEQVRRAAAEARRQADERTARFGALERTSDPDTTLADVDHDIAATRQQLAAARARIAHLTAEPAVLTQPADRLAQERDAWRIGHDAERAARRTAASAASKPGSTRSMRPPEPVPYRMRSPGTGPGIGR